MEQFQDSEEEEEDNEVQILTSKLKSSEAKTYRKLLRDLVTDISSRTNTEVEVHSWPWRLDHSLWTPEEDSLEEDMPEVQSVLHGTMKPWFFDKSKDEDKRGEECPQATSINFGPSNNAALNDPPPLSPNDFEALYGMVEKDLQLFVEDIWKAMQAKSLRSQRREGDHHQTGSSMPVPLPQSTLQATTKQAFRFLTLELAQLLRLRMYSEETLQTLDSSLKIVTKSPPGNWESALHAALLIGTPSQVITRASEEIGKREQKEKFSIFSQQPPNGH